MSATPEISLAVAALALIGVLVTALVAAGNARKRGDIEKRLLDLKAQYDSINGIQLASVQADHTRQLQELKHTHSRQLLEIQASQAQKIQELGHQNQLEIKRVEARLQQQLSAERMSEVLNEANWKRVHAQIRTLKTVALDMLGAFSTVALRGHEIEDEKLVPEVAGALKLHTDFKDLLREVRTEIREEDYRRLSSLHKYLVEVFLDLARTKKERSGRADAMLAHAKRIAIEEHYIETMASHFLQPKMASKTQSTTPVNG